MKTIQTRYRDVPVEDIKEFIRLPETWHALRGRSVTVLSGPRTGNIVATHQCVWYRVVPDRVLENGRFEVVCTHLAEIGD